MSNKKFRNDKRVNLKWSKLVDLVEPMLSMLNELNGINTIATALFIQIKEDSIRTEHLEYVKATVGQSLKCHKVLLEIYRTCHTKDKEGNSTKLTGIVSRKKIDLVESMIQRSVEIGLQISNDLLPAMENLQVLIDSVQLNLSKPDELEIL